MPGDQHRLGAAHIKKHAGPLLQKMLERLEADASVTDILEKNLVPVIEGGHADDGRFAALSGQFIDGVQQSLGRAAGQAVGAEKYSGPDWRSGWSSPPRCPES